LLEVALLLPILLMLLLGVIDLGRAFYLGIEVSNAAYAGALYGVNNSGDTAGMQNVATTDAANVSGMTATATAGCECSDGTNSSSPCPSTPPSCTVNVVNFVQVTTQATYTTWLPNYLGIPCTTASPCTLKGKAKLRL